jgi:hypothetical protein
MSEQEQKIIKGFCTTFKEQGSFLAAYNSSVKPQGQEERTYEALHFLKPGDKIKIFSQEDNQTILLEEEITPKHQLESHDRFRKWAKEDLTGERRKFIQYFSEEFPVELIPAKNPVEK